MQYFVVGVIKIVSDGDVPETHNGYIFHHSIKLGFD